MHSTELIGDGANLIKTQLIQILPVLTTYIVAPVILFHVFILSLKLSLSKIISHSSKYIGLDLYHFNR